MDQTRLELTAAARGVLPPMVLTSLSRGDVVSVFRCAGCGRRDLMGKAGVLIVSVHDDDAGATHVRLSHPLCAPQQFHPLTNGGEAAIFATCLRRRCTVRPTILLDFDPVLVYDPERETVVEATVERLEGSGLSRIRGDGGWPAMLPDVAIGWEMRLHGDEVLVLAGSETVCRVQRADFPTARAWDTSGQASLFAGAGLFGKRPFASEVLARRAAEGRMLGGLVAVS